MRFPFPLVRDRRLDRTTPVAAVEMTEADLRVFSQILHETSKREEEAARTETDRLFAYQLEGESMRFKRLANELRSAVRHHTNGAATAATAPRHDSTEIPA